MSANAGFNRVAFNATLRKMRKFQDEVFGQFHGFCEVETYYDNEDYFTIDFKVYIPKRPGEQGESFRIEWSVFNADTFPALWKEFVAAVRERLNQEGGACDE